MKQTKKRIKKSVVKKIVKNNSIKIAMFGAGCFWGIEETFRTLPGVIDTEVGYAGGTVKKATYEQVCSGQTGHAEVVGITFDSKKISYNKLLDVFWSIHDPTQMNRQGPDVGYQYRSVIFYFDEYQRKEAEESLRKEQKKHDRTIATSIEPVSIYVRAEDKHQKYIFKGGRAGCAI
ncbi:peptide-methionine (S)-S-oxide reductase MsrA [Candidatus Pacearchaeota archaeon]|nr:peptide-methionine (S)-S-oxide reductase MsrA [Candidatus Pacearchaeota archaeon]